MITYANAYRGDWFLFAADSPRPASMAVYAQIDGTLTGSNIRTPGVLYQEGVDAWFDYSTGTWADGWDGSFQMFLNPLSPLGCVKLSGATVYDHRDYSPLTSDSCPVGTAAGNDFTQQIPFGSTVGFTFPVTADKVFLSMLFGTLVETTNLTGFATTVVGTQTSDFYNTFRLSNVQFFDARGDDITGVVRYSTGSGAQLVGGTPTVSPEPGTLLMMSTGLLLVGGILRRRTTVT